jgi:hypothetical protein
MFSEVAHSLIDAEIWLIDYNGLILWRANEWISQLTLHLHLVRQHDFFGIVSSLTNLFILNFKIILKLRLKSAELSINQPPDNWSKNIVRMKM